MILSYNFDSSPIVVLTTMDQKWFLAFMELFFLMDVEMKKLTINSFTTFCL